MREDSYLVDIRFWGFAKTYLRSLKALAESKFDLPFKKKVFHTTLLRPFNTYDEDELVDRFSDYCSRFAGHKIPFTISDFDVFHNDQKIIYANINPSQELLDFRSGLEEYLDDLIAYKQSKITSSHDEGGFNPHVTLLKKGVDDSNYEWILSYLNGFTVDNPIGQYLLRVTLVKNKSIHAEYDLFQNKMLDRELAIDDSYFKRTYAEFSSKTGLVSDPAGFSKRLN